MFTKIKIPFFYWIFWILIFEMARLIFAIYFFDQSMQAGAAEMLMSLLNGLKLDMSMASYITIPIFLLMITSSYFDNKLIRIIFLSYSIVISVPISIITICDLPAFEAWGYRLDATPLRYLASPNEALASVSHLPIITIAAFWILTLFITIKLFFVFAEKFFFAISVANNKMIELIVLLFFTSIYIIPMRGGLQLAPINQSSVYFSKNNFANLSAINVTWNFMHSLSQNVTDKVNPFEYVEKEKAKKITDTLLKEKGNSIQLIKNPGNTNVIVIIWESLTKKAIDFSKNGIVVTPNFNRLKNEGVYFTNIYATGDRTDKGIVGVLSGYPSQPTTSIIKIPQKADKLPKIPQLFSNHKYQTSFYYGGELEFANMKAYLLSAGFHSFIEKSDFDSKDQNSKWGAHDGVVENKIIQDLKKNQSPFFKTWLTLSSHEPFETPVQKVIQGNDDESLFLNSLHYTDSIINHFIDFCKQQPFWANTVIVIVSDHGHRLPFSPNRINDFKIPMLWLGGGLKQTGLNINNIGSQIDLPHTLLNQWGYSVKEFEWSKNLLSSDPSPWAYFSFNNGFGFVEPDKYFIFENLGKLITEKTGNLQTDDYEKGKAVQQITYSDYLLK